MEVEPSRLTSDKVVNLTFHPEETELYQSARSVAGWPTSPRFWPAHTRAETVWQNLEQSRNPKDTRNMPLKKPYTTTVPNNGP